MIVEITVELPGAGAAGAAVPESGSGNLYTPLNCDAHLRTGWADNGLNAGP
jgi:hypothetical protein